MILLAGQATMSFFRYAFIHFIADPDGAHPAAVVANDAAAMNPPIKT